MEQQPNVCWIADLTGCLVRGIFMCKSGSDFKGRRCRGEVLVEEGPASMIGVRVLVIGRINRNRAWHFDKVWVRVLRARVACCHQQSDSPHQRWSIDTAGKSTVFGRILHAEEFHSPRQKEVVCIRSRLVRSRTKMIFRPINGKFPLITVPWETTEKPPSLHALHVIEISEWNCQDMIYGRHIQTLTNKYCSTDATLLYAVQTSLNFVDWCPGHDSLDQLLASKLPQIPAATNKNGRIDLRAHITISIENDNWPANVAYSFVDDAGRLKLHIHVVDINEYLDTEECSVIDDLARQRGAGAWFTDFAGQGLPSHLPLLPSEVERRAKFGSGKENLAITFCFLVDVSTWSVDVNSVRHFESRVLCKKVLSIQQAAECIVDPAGGGEEGSILKRLHKLIRALESAAVTESRSSFMEHLDMNSLLQSQSTSLTHVDSCRHVHSIIAGASFLVNQYAGNVVAKPKVWSSLIRPEAITGCATNLTAPQQVMPQLIFGKADQSTIRSFHQLLHAEISVIQPMSTKVELISACSSKHYGKL